MRPDWLPDWSGEVCAIVAGGASARQEDVDRLRGRCRVAVVNNSFRLAPWADLLYACDKKWWLLNWDEARHFAGLKVTQDRDFAAHRKIGMVSLYPDDHPSAQRISVDVLGLIGRGGNGGFQLMNIVAQTGVKRIIGLGFDFIGEHWHGQHPKPLHNPSEKTMAEWARKFDAAAPDLRALNIEFVNVSNRSALAAYRRSSLAEILEEWTP